MLNDAPPIPTNQPEPAETDDIDLSDLPPIRTCPPLIHSDPNLNLPPQPQVFVDEFPAPCTSNCFRLVHY